MGGIGETRKGGGEACWGIEQKKTFLFLILVKLAYLKTRKSFLGEASTNNKRRLLKSAPLLLFSRVLKSTPLSMQQEGSSSPTTTSSISSAWKKTGYLKKKSGSVSKVWQTRWHVAESSGRLCWWKDKHDSKDQDHSPPPRGFVRIFVVLITCF